MNRNKNTNIKKKLLTKQLECDTMIVEFYAAEASKYCVSKGIGYETQNFPANLHNF